MYRDFGAVVDKIVMDAVILFSLFFAVKGLLLYSLFFHDVSNLFLACQVKTKEKVQ